MSAYDFTGLSPSDFESLCHDLLESSLGVPLQEFVTGRDKGIDLRHAPINGRDWIVQAKHFARSGFAKLRSHIATKELPKIKKLRPGRYILATSVGLSPSNVDELFELLSPYCQSKHDILGRDDLNAILRANGTIEQRHFKLWLTSEAVLSRVLHNDVFIQSALTEEQIKLKLGLYVYTASFDKAMKKLEAERVCILSGVPGVGKTTLAEMLILQYLMKDWQVVAIHQNVAEGQKLFRADLEAKQILYYDDFLGQISTGEKLGKNEDRSLLQLIGAVNRKANKRFVLTTREYILAQARAEHEQLARSDIDIFRFVVSCDDYSDVDKARILANHLFFADVPQEHIAALVEDRTYLKIISHRNYNPRIIEWMTHITEVASCKPNEYPATFLDRLEHPEALWTHAFENQISEAGRHLLLVLASCGDGILLADLKEAFEAFYADRVKIFGFPASPSSFSKALEELEGNFIRIERSDKQLVVSCHNPSILDFLNLRFINQPADVTALLRNATFFEQVERLFDVFHVEPKRGSNKGSAGFDPEAAATAIDRTLLARSVRFVRSGLPSNKWRRSPSSIWDRLGCCCRIGSQLHDAKVRHTIHEHLDAHFAEIDRHTGEMSDILPLLGVIEGCKWVDKSSFDRWENDIAEHLYGIQDKFDESLDGLAATIEWFAESRHRFEDSRAEQLEESLAKAVSHQIEYSERNDPERLGGDLAIVEQIAKTLGRDFSEEIEWLQNSLAECPSRDAGDDEDWRDHRRGTDTTSIHSIFDSLLE